MSAFGTKRTCQSLSGMFAFGGKADISRTYPNVCLWIKSDIEARRRIAEQMTDVVAESHARIGKWAAQRMFQRVFQRHDMHAFGTTLQANGFCPNDIVDSVS
jgi:hypothetical protein